jgi:hypothetical protein
VVDDGAMMGNPARQPNWGTAMRRLMTGFAVYVLAAAGFSTFALAQDDTPRPRLQRPPLRLEIEPQRRLVRECRDWHVIEHRLTGDTIVPRTQCRWALR